jgi:hypothetical protein
VTPHRLTTLAVGCFVSISFAAAMRMPSARAEENNRAGAPITQGRGYRGAPPPQPRSDPGAATPRSGAGGQTDITGLYFTHFRCRNRDYDGKLALFASSDRDAVLTGFMTIVMPYGSDTRTMTFKLAGRLLLPRSFLIRAVPPIPSGVPFGALRGDDAGWSNGKILASMEGCGDTMVATRDATESPKITSITTAEQVAEAPLPDPVAVRAARVAEAVAQNRRAMEEIHPGGRVPYDSPTNNRPPSFSNAGLVRKSANYWRGFHSDVIREIFDGGFGADVEESTPFKVLFTSYVESYSKSCRASLPANHTAITMTSVTARVDRFGNVVSQNANYSVTVEADPRFAPKYREYAAALSSSAVALGILTSGRRVNTLLDPLLDIAQFFEDQKCQGPAMHQLTENLLRGALDKNSLQQAGETIAGAAADTDPSTPPGLTHFSDACHAYYRDPAHPEQSSRNASHWCSCLGDQYRNRMTTADEAFFASDFKQFLNLAAGTKPSTGDVTTWERFHAGADACRQ